MDDIQNGVSLTYDKDDAGRVLDTGLWLLPGQPVVVGTHLNGGLASRLLEDGVCILTPSEAVVKEDVPAEKEIQRETPVERVAIAMPPPALVQQPPAEQNAEAAS
jgi:hypothetical protein